MTFKGTLYPYQRQAAARMVRWERALVAYDMGTGKTVITIAAIEHLMDRWRITEPGIVVVLASLKYQWQKAIEQFSTDSRALVIDGTPTQRAKQYDEAMRWQETGVDYIVMSYNQVVDDWETVKDLPRGFLILDEATAIKSFRAKRTKRVKRLAEGAPFRYALTGTPADNGKPEELYSIMQAVDPALLGNPRTFDQRYIERTPFGAVRRYKRLPEFRQKMNTVLLRKRQTDPDVAPYMPQTIEPDPLMVNMPPAYKKGYKKIAGDLLEELDNAASLGITGGNFNVLTHYGQGAPIGMDKDTGQVLGRVASRLQALRLYCSDPALLCNSASEYVSELQDEGYDFSKIPSPKLKAVETYVRDHLDADERNKVVIFTHWVGMVEILVRAFARQGAVGYSGKMNAKQKEAAKVQFQTDPDTRVLVSSDAGGYGVDLPQANLLLNYDLAETSGAQAQRDARIKRASSTWPTVTVQSALMKDSIEERMLAALRQKSDVQAALIDGEGIDRTGSLTLTLGSLSKFLNKTIR